MSIRSDSNTHYFKRWRPQKPTAAKQKKEFVCRHADHGQTEVYVIPPISGWINYTIIRGGNK